MKNILLVDDNSIIVQSVERLLGKEGYNVQSATNGKDAVRLMDQMVYDLVVTDLAMPFMDGTELIKYITGKYEDMPIIVISSNQDEKRKMECYALGIENFLTKPFPPMELLMKIKRLVGQ